MDNEGWPTLNPTDTTLLWNVLIIDQNEIQIKSSDLIPIKIVCYCVHDITSELFMKQV